MIALDSSLCLLPVRSIKSSALILLSSLSCDDLRTLSDSRPLLTIASWNLLKIYYIDALRNDGYESSHLDEVSLSLYVLKLQSSRSPLGPTETNLRSSVSSLSDELPSLLIIYYVLIFNKKGCLRVMT